MNNNRKREDPIINKELRERIAQAVVIAVKEYLETTWREALSSEQKGQRRVEVLIPGRIVERIEHPNWQGRTIAEIARGTVQDNKIRSREERS